MRHPVVPPAYRRHIQLGIALFAVGLLVPTALWLSFPRPQVTGLPPATATPQIVRVGRSLDQPIPADWQPPELNPQLEAAALAIPDTLPLSETGQLSATLPIVDRLFEVNLPALVASPALNLRDGPGGGYVPVQVLNQTTPLTAVGRFAGWYQVVTAGGVLGWVDSDFVSLGVPSSTLPLASTIPDPDPALLAQLDAAAANLRSGPDRSYAALAQLSPTDGALTLLTRRENWYNVQTAGGAEGWVSADLLTTSDYVARRVPVLTANPQALEAVRQARSYLGYAYVWGGATPRQGFDCSGLVKYVYGKLGVELPHGSAEQWRGGYGQKITRQRDLRPGDIVFFENTYRRGISHVGIYAGNRLIIQAISEKVGIRVSSLDTDYWADRYVGAIRIFE
ncbi:MAG: C40 family peptidase [Herpetosiphonaceae bacterium]|nr:C40 family peptidase [Herpetosiphonaceae bacterium]